MWTKKERFEAVLNHELADRPPVSAWRHFTENEHSGIVERVQGKGTFFLHDYICRHFDEKPTHIRVFVDTPLTSDMELSLLNAPPEKLFSWDTFLYHGDQVLAVTTTVSMPRENRPFITLEF